MYEDVDASIVTKKKKSDAKEEDYDKAYTEALSGQIVPIPESEMNQAEKVIWSLNWNPINFAHEWRMNRRLMSLETFSRSNRVYHRRGERVLVMSGQSWNADTHSAARDWSNVLAAITLETALLESYRFDLLKACPGACALRKEMKEFFLSIATPFHKKHPTTGVTERTIEWDFPDGIPFTIGTCGGRLYDPDDLRKQLRGMNPTAVRSKAKRNNVRTTIEYLEKNKFLWASDPDAPYGSVETLAHQCISTLADVCQPFIAPYVLRDGLCLDVYR